MIQYNFEEGLSDQQKLQRLYDCCYINEKPVVAVITEYSNYFGFTLKIDGLLADMNKHELTDAYLDLDDYQAYVGKSILVKLLSVDIYSKKIRVSRKKLAHSFKKGKIVQGLVHEIIGNRMHVDVGFLARVHIRDMSDNYVKDINAKFQVGQLVDVVLLNDYHYQRYTEASTKPSIIWQAKTQDINVKDLIIVSIQEIKEGGVIVAFSDYIQEGYVGRDFLTNGYKKLFEANEIKLGSTIEVSVSKIDEVKHRIFLNMKEAEKIRTQRAMQLLRSQLTLGDVIEAEVIEITRHDATLHIVGTDVNYIMSRKELSPNKVTDAAEEVFVGEVLPIAYLGDNGDRLHFTRKFHVENKYEDSLYDLPLKKLLQTMEISSNKFVGRASKIGDNVFFTDLMSSEGSQSDDYGKLLVDPITGKRIIVIAPETLFSELVIGSFYEIEIALANEQKRKQEGTPYIFRLNNHHVKLVGDPYKESVSLAFKKYTSPAANSSLSYLLNEVGQNLYTSKKRMFFELLQNADDAASQSGVRVKIQMCGEYFVLTHNGYAFNKQDFTSITSAAKSTKSASKKKTGYKGIGFKSVFTNSSTVQIKSGGYNFLFDKSYNRFNNFRDFYFFVMEIENDEAKQTEFLYKFESESKDFKGVKDLPWQLLPIWSDSTHINEESIFNQDENVAIALKMDNDTLADYYRSIKEVFEEPRFMLFLRNTRRVQILQDKGECLTIQKNISDGGKSISLVNSFLPNKTEKYRIFSVENIPVNNEEFERCGIYLRRFERTNIRGDKEFYLSRIDQNGNESSEIDVPDRIASAEFSSISFAIRLDENDHISSIGNELSLYAYLPMSEHRFRFSFYINADFIPKSDREGIQSDNPWNYFLFYTIGRSIVKMVADAASLDEPNYLDLLPTKLFETNSQDTSAISESFNRGYLEAIQETAFILNDLGETSKSEDIIIDESHLSEYVDSEFFYQFIGTSKRLPNNRLSSRVLSEDLFGIERLSREKVLAKFLVNIAFVNEWLDKTASEKRNRLFDWILESGAHTLLKKVHIFEFGDKWYSSEEIKLEDKLVISTEKTFAITEILTKLGFLCSSTPIEEHYLHDHITKQSETDLFKCIQSADISSLSFDERLLLFKTISEFELVRKDTIKKWKVFKNQEGNFSSPSELFTFYHNTPDWLFKYMINEDECDDFLNAFLIDKENIYSSIVESKIEDLLDKTDIEVIYNQFKNDWRLSFTQLLIEKKVSNVIAVVENEPNASAAFIKAIDKLDLNTQTDYLPNSLEYRILKIASTSSECRSLIRNRITINGEPLKSISVKDEFLITLNSVQYTFNVSKILPSFKKSSDLSIVTKKFESIPSSDLVFAQNEVNSTDVRDKLHSLLLSRTILLTEEQFCFLMVYRKNQGYGYFESNLVPYLGTINESLLIRIIERSFNLKIGELLSTFLRTPNLKLPYKIFGTYINCDEYTLADERIPLAIKNWANTQEKKEFLKNLGIHDEQGNEIIRRKSFKENKHENIWNITDPRIITSFFRWIEDSFALPITSENQVAILEGLFSVLKTNVLKQYDESDCINASEWANPLYLKWKQNSNIRILIIDGMIPYRGYDTSFFPYKYLFKGYKGEYVFFNNSRTLYISSNREPASVLADVYPIQSIPFNKDDWNKIFLVSADVVLEKDKRIAELERLLEDALRNNNGDESEVRNHGEYVERDNTDPETRIELNREACFAAKDFLDSLDDYDCSSWNPEITGNIIRDKIFYKGKKIVVAVTSSRGRKLYLHPYVFAEIMEDPDNLLLNYGYDHRIHSLRFKDVFEDNPNVNLIFDTDVISPKHIAELANKYRVSRKTCFVIENPKYSQSDVIQSFGLQEKKEDGIVNLNLSDDDIFGTF